MIIFLATLYFVVAPLLLYRKLKLPSSPPWIEWDTEDGSKPRTAQRSQESITQNLVPLGFSIVGAIRAETKTIDIFEVNCGHNNGTDRASVATMHLIPLKQERRFVEFVTEYRDGSHIATSNGDILDGKFVPRPGCHSFRFPKIQDIALLYRLHQAGVEHYGSTAPKLPWSDEDLAERRNAEEEKVTQHQIACHRLKKNSDGTRSPTLLGAFAMTWLSVFPFVHILRATRFWKCRQLRKSEAAHNGS